MGVLQEQNLSDSALPLLSLNHVSYLCKSVTESAKFYQEVIGFVLIRRPSSFQFEGAWLFNYGIGIHLLQCNCINDVQQMPVKINPKDNHISFQVSSALWFKLQTKSIVSESLYLIVAGSDDLANTYFASRLRSNYDVPAYSDLMVQGATNIVQELYDMGARRFAVFSAPPIGCIPSQRTLGGGKERNCAESYNQAAEMFNSKLSASLDNLNANKLNMVGLYILISTILSKMLSTVLAIMVSKRHQKDVVEQER